MGCFCYENMAFPLPITFYTEHNLLIIRTPLILTCFPEKSAFAKSNGKRRCFDEARKMHNVSKTDNKTTFCQYAHGKNHTLKQHFLQSK